ncbi:MAG: hypothetical protein Q7U53_01600 [Anaerolineaceae bacterium]|nr:hypothetical protein [Anaerolineaceae bacterium]
MSTAEITFEAKAVTASEETYGTGYLEERKLVGRWRSPWPQIVSFLFVAAIFYATWWIFMDPRGIMRLYTPQIGYMYTRWMLIIAIWMVYLMHYWPFKRKWLENAHPVLKGIVLTAVLAGVLLIVIRVFFFGFIGNYAITYFSPKLMMELGITEFFAMEYASLACLMFASLASWLSPAWPVAFENRPWDKLKQPALGFTVLAVTFLIAMLIYLATMHSHMAILFYPWQQYTAVTPPWWMDFAGTVSGNFHIAWIMSCTVVVWLVETIWERWPFTELKKPGLRGIVTFFGIILLAFAFAFGVYYMQELRWGPAIMGDRYMDDPGWRWLHVGETLVFFLLPAMFINFYCGNWPQKFSKPLNWTIRTLLTFALGIVVYVIYYKTGHLYLGVQQDMAHAQQFPMVPTIWFINMMLVHHWFMDNWPGFKKVKVSEKEVTE